MNKVLGIILNELRAEIERRWKHHRKNFLEREEDGDKMEEDAYLLQYFADLESEKPVPNDLEEATRRYQEDVPVDTTIHYCGADEDVYFANRIVDAFIAGYNLCKEHMMKGAVEGEVVKDINNKLAVTAKNVDLDKFKFGDKVKIIIVKE